jgi:hypothetical protein
MNTDTELFDEEAFDFDCSDMSTSDYSPTTMLKEFEGLQTFQTYKSE